MTAARRLEDQSPMPVRGDHYGARMEDIPDDYLVWLYEQPWLMKKYAEVHAYIVRNEVAIPDLILTAEDRAAKAAGKYL